MDNIKIIKKSALYFVGNIASKMMSFLLLPIYAYFITSSDLGEFDYIQTIINVTMPISFCAIWESILRFVLLSNSDEERKKIITTVSFFLIFCASVLGITGILCFWIQINNINVYIIIVITIIFAFAETWQYYARAFQKNNLYVLSGVVASVVNLGSIIISVCIFKQGIIGLFISTLLGQLSTFILIESKLKIRKKLSMQYFDKKLLQILVKYSAPLVLNLISTWLIAGYGRILIVNRLGVSENGLFSFASKFSLIITTVGSVIIKAVIEESIIEFDSLSQNNSFGKTINNIFEIFQNLSIIALPAVSIFFYLIEKTDYYEALQYVPWLIAYALMTTLSSNIGAIFQAYNKTIFQMTATIIGAVVMVILSTILIDEYKLTGVAFAQLSGAFLMMFLRYCFAKRLCTINIEWIKIFSKFVIYVIIAIFSLHIDIKLNITLAIFLSVIILRKYYRKILMLRSK